MYFTYNKKTKKVSMYSQNENEYSNKDWKDIEIIPTKEEQEKMDLGYEIYIKNKKLSFKKNGFIEKDDRIKEKKEILKKLDVENITVKELKKEIKNIINLIK